MTAIQFLKQYRDTRLELTVMERHLEQCGITGRPAGYVAMRTDGMPRGTNDRVSAALQAQDGLEAAVSELRSQLDAMEPRFSRMMSAARNYRERCILRQYYQLGHTDAQIADCLGVSVRHANRLRSDMLEHFNNTSMMSTPVVACPVKAC